MGITIAGKRQGGVKPYPTAADFPNPGKTGIIYVDLFTDTEYLWDAETSTYVSPGGGVSVPPASTTEAGVTKYATNDLVVGLTDDTTALTAASLVGGSGVVNWLNGVAIDIGLGNVAAFGSGRLSMSNGTDTGVLQLVDASGNAGLYFASSAGLANLESPTGFQVSGSMNWGSYADGTSAGGRILDQGDNGTTFEFRNTYDGIEGTFGINGCRVIDSLTPGNFTRQGAYRYAQEGDGLVGGATFAGFSTSIDFRNGGSPVSISTDGGAVAFMGYGINIGSCNIHEDISGVLLTTNEFDFYGPVVFGGSLLSTSESVFAGVADFSGASPLAAGSKALPGDATDLASAIALANAVRALLGNSAGWGLATL